MKKLLAIGLAAAFALTLAACGNNGNDEAVEDGAEVGMENPWTEAASADDAAQKAGIASFEVADNIGLGPQYPLGEPLFQSMDGIAEAQYTADGYKVVVRKGDTTGVDLSGDYNEYPESWTQDVDGITVECMGYEVDSASNLSWSTDSDNISVCFYSDGGENIGLTDAQVIGLVHSVK